MTALTLTRAPSGAAPRRRGIGALAVIGYLVVAAEIVVFSLASPAFPTASNAATVLLQAAVPAIAGFGLAIVVITGGDDVVTGGIDLSSGPVVGLSGVVAAVAVQSGWQALPAIALALLVSVGFGAVNGTAVMLGLRPLLATLATSGIVTSVVFLATDNVKVPLTDPLFAWLRSGTVLGVPSPVVVLGITAALTGLLVGRTPWGVRSYAVGQNRTAASVAGIAVWRYVGGSYVLAGLLAGVAGILLAARLAAAVPGIGAQILLDIILTAFLSVVFSRRLVVTIGGTLLAAVFVAALGNGFTLLGVGSQWVGAIKGVLILLVLGLAAVRERGSRR
ncbi:ABC transporter permease [Rathayibacter tanaceti]|uniref:ABC transporter permease n=2 Tax=Rathayibacter tanaceti TaxID=1671680 RepID=A0A162J089_9MICO|nr:ABC transporter permease [Rathayibacter tanaceti]KZX20327.1 Ribose transport system permease protein RbsC [Rathayibacter tanaceti]QHC55327.1 ABC transporter permease [Rathayibacter tanaceti]TCO36372.1 ribose transport system permease protein [Rathayibacter tanaceti]